MVPAKVRSSFGNGTNDFTPVSEVVASRMKAREAIANGKLTTDVANDSITMDFQSEGGRGNRNTCQNRSLRESSEDEEKPEREDLPDIITLLQREDFSIEDFLQEHKTQQTNIINDHEIKSGSNSILSVDANGLEKITSNNDTAMPSGTSTKVKTKMVTRVQEMAGKPKSSNDSPATEKKRSSNRMKNRYELQWDDMFQKLRAYKEKNGSTIVPRRYEPFPALGTWVATQRRRCTRKDRMKKLNAIGFIWEVKDSKQSPACCKHCQAFKQTQARKLGFFPSDHLCAKGSHGTTE